ncbi:MAG: hypothetical protein GY845_37805 [Planctomycetes bacterium]|nr:hypothetical protein [Planctomycetota bacterium]
MSTEEKSQLPEKSQKTAFEESQEQVAPERQRRGQYIANGDNTEPPGRGQYLAGADNTESPEETDPPESDPTSF